MDRQLRLDQINNEFSKLITQLFAEFGPLTACNTAETFILLIEMEINSAENEMAGTEV